MLGWWVLDGAFQGSARVLEWHARMQGGACSSTGYCSGGLQLRVGGRVYCGRDAALIRGWHECIPMQWGRYRRAGIADEIEGM